MARFLSFHTGLLLPSSMSSTIDAVLHVNLVDTIVVLLLVQAVNICCLYVAQVKVATGFHVCLL